jgi:RHS repeat-associated protein
LINFAGAILELYAFDAYGNAIGFDPSVALTEFLYSGEQFDSKIGQQYLRARYYNPVTGRFNRLDPFFGNLIDPQSLHKYLYTHADPVTYTDPTGKFIPILLTAMGIGALVGGISTWLLGGSPSAIFWGTLGGATLGAGLGPLIAANTFGALALSASTTTTLNLLATTGGIMFIRQLFWSYGGTSWGIKDTKSNNITPKKVAIVEGHLGTLFDAAMLGSTFSLEPFVHSIKKAGHTVMNDKSYISPSEEEFINICNTPDLDILIILAHGEGNYLMKTDYYEMVNNNLVFLTGFQLGGKLPTKANFMYDSNGNRQRSLPANWITSTELEGKINNPKLVVAAASCYSAKLPMDSNQNLRMVEAMNPKHYIGASNSIDVASSIAIFLLAVDYLNNGDNADFMSNNGGKYTIVGGK